MVTWKSLRVSTVPILNPFRSMGLKFALRPTTHKVWVFCTVYFLLERIAGGEYPNRATVPILNPFRSMGLKFALRPTTYKVWLFCTVSILLEKIAGAEYPNRTN